MNAQDQNGAAALHCAAMAGHAEVVTALVALVADVSTQAQNGAKALHIAAAEGHLEAVKALVQRGADLEALANQGQLHGAGLGHRKRSQSSRSVAHHLRRHQRCAQRRNAGAAPPTIALSATPPLRPASVRPVRGD